MARSDLFRPLRYCGRNSIVIYLAFFLPMALSRTLLLKTGWIADIGVVSLLVTATGVIGALAPVLGGAPHLPALPVRAARPVLDRAEEGKSARRPCLAARRVAPQAPQTCRVGDAPGT